MGFVSFLAKKRPKSDRFNKLGFNADQINQRLREDAQVISSGGFDAEYYLSSNPDVAAKGIDPFEHFMDYGRHEGRRGVPLATAVPAIGVKEARLKRESERIAASGLFDEDWYFYNNADITKTEMAPLAHFVEFGRGEGRRPGPGFDPTWYAGLYGERLGAYDPLYHYISIGQDKGFRPLPPYAEGGIKISARPDARTPSGEPTRTIFIRTYEDDAIRLYYTLLSIAKFCIGYDSVVVVCQKKAMSAITPVVDAFDFIDLQTCPVYANDYIGQQVTKLLAYRYTENDIVFHIDSDCIFTERVDIGNYTVNRKPILFHRSYNDIYRAFQISPWQEPTSRFLLRQVDHEFMCGFPLAYPRKLYVDLHAWFLKYHDFDYDKIVDRLAWKDNFSEFNLLGAFSFYSENAYHHFEPTGGAFFDFKTKQFCRGMDRSDRTLSLRELTEIESLLGV